MSEDYSSVDRLGADVGPEYFRCVNCEATERKLSGYNGWDYWKISQFIRQCVWRRGTGTYVSFRGICSPFNRWDCWEHLTGLFSAGL